MRTIGQDLMGSRRFVVAQVESVAPAAMHAGQQGRGAVVVVQTGKDVAGFLDVARFARYQSLDDVAAWAVEAGQAEDIDSVVKAAPLVFGQDAAAAFRRRRRSRAVLPYPAAIAVAIDAGGRQIADPFAWRLHQMRRHGGKSRATVITRRGADQQA